MRNQNRIRIRLAMRMGADIVASQGLLHPLDHLHDIRAALARVSTLQEIDDILGTLAAACDRRIVMRSGEIVEDVVAETLS